ncbi:MAG TPA: hypothetical protein DCQ13_07085 [Firmicutes bacterium]|nr:hypothetical protein [Bacillota bacterium]
MQCAQRMRWFYEGRGFAGKVCLGGRGRCSVEIGGARFRQPVVDLPSEAIARRGQMDKCQGVSENARGLSWLCTTSCLAMLARGRQLRES